MNILPFLFDPLPEASGYDNPRIIVMFAVAIGLIVASFVLRSWKAKQTNPVTKKLARSWPTAAFWFGATAIIFTVARTEAVFFLSARFLWLLWLLALAAYVFLQVRLFRTRHYTVVQSAKAEDPREKYLPKQKRR